METIRKLDVGTLLAWFVFALAVLSWQTIRHPLDWRQWTFVATVAAVVGLAALRYGRDRTTKSLCVWLTVVLLIGLAPTRSVPWTVRMAIDVIVAIGVTALAIRAFRQIL